MFILLNAFQGEFLLGITLMSSRDRIVEKLRFIFDIYDLDGDGRIDQKEMIKVIECLYDLRDLPKSDKSGKYFMHKFLGIWNIF